ncbi:IMPACT family protein [Hydrogenophaga crassostreae]|uniref:IMPACT family protein n=1 Tax=Hydrogenophaga crassostreae TaxID=1763535 RepID=A0A167GML4_9BURK|nr:YigZ family protein [Hydrogenophaga crassostreae]AOW14830.1 IMPACT family protein [Hydrogenophaga crassostreae]OAD39659.1 IMPACT family protein [Hydrogenophaga crassostreae]
MPFTLQNPVHSELVIKKSRFIGCVEPCAGREAALARVAELRTEHPGATHVCWALMAGGHSAANDDGEPGGTAGRPMLEVLRHQDLEGVLATVVRYYGGIQLGAGGLVRAYTDSVAQALLKAEKAPVIHHSSLRCLVPYALEGWLRRELDAHSAHLMEALHGEGVEVTLSVPEANTAALVSRINDAGQGQVIWRKTENETD